MKFIKIPLTKQMEDDYRECATMMDNGEEKECEGCSLSGGSEFECLGNIPGAVRRCRTGGDAIGKAYFRAIHGPSGGRAQSGEADTIPE